jgi:phage N-6-adenine-methyltransferase
LSAPVQAYHKQGETVEWATPVAVFDRYDAEFGFTLDVCANAGNAKCVRFFSKEQDGLSQSWAGETCWMNPPYGREIREWIRKAYEEGQAGATVVCLVPARTDSAWWHDFAMKGEIRFIRGRIKFGGAQHNAPFPCALVVFRPDADEKAPSNRDDVLPLEGNDKGGMDR